MKLRQKIIEEWHKVPQKKQNLILVYAEKVLNYLLNSLLLAIPCYFFSTLFLGGHDFVRYLIIFVSLFVLLPFIEHYYIWFRDGWMNDISNDKP